MANIAGCLVGILSEDTTLVSEKKEVPFFTREGRLFSLRRRYEELGAEGEGERQQVLGKNRPTNLEYTYTNNYVTLVNRMIFSGRNLIQKKTTVNGSFGKSETPDIQTILLWTKVFRLIDCIDPMSDRIL